MWLKREDIISKQELKDISLKHNISLIKSVILSRRKINKDDFIYYIGNDVDKAHNPFLFNDMEKAVDRITECRNDNEKLLVFGDRDADGITATSILINYFRKEGFDVKYRLPQGDDNYGISKEIIDKFHKDGGSLIITIDCGISNVEEIKYANSQGIDVIIIDHHNVKDTIPQAYAILNPKMPDTKYPFPGLCSGALATKVILAIEFSKTQHYRQNMTFLTLDIDKETVKINVLNSRNFTVLSRHSYTVETKNISSKSYSDLYSLISTKVLYMYDIKDEEKTIISIVFANFECSVFDIKEDVKKYLPNILKYSLKEIKQKSSYYKFIEDFDENMALMNVFESMVSKHTGYKEYYKSVLDISAISTISDMMPLTDENRLIVKYGLSRLQNTINPGLLALIRDRNIDLYNLNEDVISWQITPLINSTGRMGEPHLAVELLTAKNDTDYLVEKILDLDSKRRKLSNGSWDLLENKAHKSYLDNDKKIIVLMDDELNRGVISMLAIRTLNQFNTPVMVMAKADNRIIGSVRSTKDLNFKITDFLDKFKDLFTDYGGHDFAGGFNLSIDKYETFLNRLNDEIKNIDLAKTDFKKYYDLIIESSYLETSYGEFEDLYKDFAPFGKDFESLIFYYKNAKIYDLKEFGKTKFNIKFSFRFGPKILSGVLWGVSKSNVSDYKVGQDVDLYFCLKKDLYSKSNLEPVIDILDIVKIQ